MILRGLAGSLIRFAHRGLWRKLPRKLRRNLLLIGASAAAPRVVREVRAKGPVIVVGRLCNASGLGGVARACHDALKAEGIEVYGIDISRVLMCELDFPDFEFEDGRGLVGDGLVLLHVSGDLVPLAVACLGRRFVDRKRIIAHWFWEIATLPRSWGAALAHVHEIWVNTLFVEDAVRSLDPSLAVQVVSLPIARPPARSAPRPSDTNPFTVLAVFNVASGFERKNPCGSIDAFRRAFGDNSNVKLIVKYSNASHWPQAVRLLEAAARGASNIELQGGNLDEAGMEDLYAKADAVISMHRAEGFGLVPAEAALRGIPVVATDWPSTRAFLTDKTGCPIPYHLVPMVDPQHVYEGQLWAEPNIEAAAGALRRLRADAGYRRALGEEARSISSALFDPREYAEEVRLYLAGAEGIANADAPNYS